MEKTIASLLSFLEPSSTITPVNVPRRKQSKWGKQSESIHLESISEAIKNPEIKAKLLDEAVKAVSQAIQKGRCMTTQELINMAVRSMRDSLAKGIRSSVLGVEELFKLTNQFSTAISSQSDDCFSYDFEINDLPLSARQRVCNRQFLKGIQHQTKCCISPRGQVVEAPRKRGVGCRKLYLHIQGQNKYCVREAYKHIKLQLEQPLDQTTLLGKPADNSSL